MMRVPATLLLATVLFLLHMDVMEAQHSSDRSLSTSITGMVYLLEYEEKLIDNLAEYANLLQQKITTIQNAITIMRNELAKSKHNELEYLSNPLNSFKLIRRLHMDWVNWELFMQKSVGAEQIKFLQDIRKDLPERSDLEEAVESVHRLQIAYALDPVDMANGILGGQQYGANLSALDCYTIGNELLILKPQPLYEAGIWIYGAVQVYKSSLIFDAFGFDKLDIYMLYAEILAKQKRWSDMFDTLEFAAADYPHSSQLLDRRSQLQKMANLDLTSTPQFKRKKPLPHYRGCRGEYPPNRSSQLFCLYNTTTTPFLTLAPMKMELLSVDPYMVLYHDIISNDEIEILKTAAIPDLKRSTIFDEKLRKSVPSKARTSKVAWLPDNTNNITIRVNQRIHDMTGFNLRGSEMLQMMNYGLGGHYNTHHDFFSTVSQSQEFIYGNRMATIIFYLNDVESGGATVFPDLELAIFPRKGTAAMWYNLDNTMEGNPKTMHAACPVLIGSKWVCNKWIRVKNQIFIKPCARQ